MGPFLRYFIVIIAVSASFVVAIDDADARRFRWRSGGSRSVVVPTSVPTAGAAGAAGAAVAATGAITLVHNMPDTNDFAYGNGHFDVGFRETEDGKGEYVIYHGDLASPLKPDLQKGIADMVGFDPVERHKASRKAMPVSAPVEGQQHGGKATFSSSVPWLSILFLLIFIGAGLFRLWRWFAYRDIPQTPGTNAPDMEARINERLRELRAQR